MASITALGTGSGLDLEGLLTKLMSVEQQPLVALQNKQTSYESTISSLGSLKSVLASLQTAAAAMVPDTGTTATNKYASYKTSVADTSIATASASAAAATGTYSLTDIKLATAQQIQKTGVTVPSGAGTLSIQVGTGTTVDVSINAGSSLSNVVSAINASNAGVNASVVSSVVDGVTTDHLFLTSNSTGAANTISITGKGTGWTDSDFNYSGTTTNSWTQTEGTGSDASLSINGIATTSASNTLTTAVSGLTINLVKAGATTVTVTKDSTTNLTSVLNAFVTAYNSANTSMGSLGTYNATTKVAGALQGDATLRSAKNQVTNLLFNTVAGGSSDIQRLTDIGISLAKDGSLSLDTTKLNKAITSDYSSVANLVAKVGDAYNTTLDNIVGTSGSLVTATKSYTSMVSDLKDRETELSDRLTQIEARYRKQFTALDNLVSSLNSTSSYLTQQLKSSSSSSS